MKKITPLLIIFHFFYINNFSATISNVTKNTDPVQKYKKFELTFSVSTNATNLYDPNQIDVYVTFTGPDSSSYRINCFPYQNYVRSGNQSSQGSPFTVINSTKHGFIRISNIDKHYFAFEDGTPIFFQEKILHGIIIQKDITPMFMIIT